MSTPSYVFSSSSTCLVNIFLRTRGYQNIFGPEDQDISDTGHNKISRPDNQDLAISLLGGKI
jgi:hypothetical protein